MSRGSRARRDGYAAHCPGETYEEARARCPYRRDVHLRGCWLDGWVEAQSDYLRQQDVEREQRETLDEIEQELDLDQFTEGQIEQLREFAKKILEKAGAL